MESYTNFSHLPHLLTITDRLNKNIVLKKKFHNESEAIRYLNEAREFQNNKNKFNFVISGPNMFYSV